MESSSLPITLFKGRSFEHTSNQPYSLLRFLFAHSFNILDSDSLDDMRQKLVSGLVNYLPGEPVMKAHFIGALAGYDLATAPTSWLEQTRSKSATGHYLPGAVLDSSNEGKSGGDLPG